MYVGLCVLVVCVCGLSVFVRLYLCGGGYVCVAVCGCEWWWFVFGCVCMWLWFVWFSIRV